MTRAWPGMLGGKGVIQVCTRESYICNSDGLSGAAVTGSVAGNIRLEARSTRLR